MLSLSALKPHQLLTQALNFLLVLSTAFMLWKGLSVAADSKSPIVVVLSGSMEPAFQRGDLLFLWNRDGLLPSLSELFPNPFATATTYGSDKGKAALVRRKDIKVGEIVVYEVRGKEIPIVHRVVRRFGGCDDESEAERRARGGLCDKPTHLLTKGDNNAADDTELYARGQGFLDRDRDVVGSVVGFVPFVGYGTILLSEYPWLKTAMLGLMGLTVVLQRE